METCSIDSFSNNVNNEPKHKEWILLVSLYSTIILISVLGFLMAIVTCFCHEMRRKIRVKISFLMSLTKKKFFVSLSLTFKDWII